MSSDYTDAIVGQQELKGYVCAHDLTTFPHSIIFLGDIGCGKHLFCDYIADKFQLEKVEIDTKLTPDQLEEIYSRAYPTLCVFNLETLDSKFQFSLLKTLEEARPNLFMICLSSNVSQVLPTLLNRCQKWIFSNYSREELESFIDSKYISKRDLLLDIFHTPGQVKEAQYFDVDSMVSLADNIVHRIGKASLPNILSISDKIAFRGEKDKFNLDLFVRVLEYCILRTVKVDGDPLYLKLFNEIIQLRPRSALSINKQYMFESFLMSLKGIT